jgi:hypothetical protein
VYAYKKNIQNATLNNLVKVIFKGIYYVHISSLDAPPFQKHVNINGRMDYQENNKALC